MHYEPGTTTASFPTATVRLWPSSILVPVSQRVSNGSWNQDKFNGWREFAYVDRLT